MLEKRALIALHGRGGSAQDILKLAKILCDASFNITAPEAPNHSWYPHSFMAPEETNEPFLSNSVAAVKKLIDDISLHIPKNQITIMGFSQGACLSLETAARYADQYAGVIAFTGGLIGDILRPEKYKGDFAGTKVFIGNSDKDPHVPLSRSQESKELMQKLGALVTLKVYPSMGHVINEDEINWVKKNILHE